MDFGSLLGIVAGLLGFALVGVALRVSGLLKSEDAKVLNTVLLYSALPVLIFSSVQRAEIDGSLAALPLLGWGLALTGLLLAWAAAKALRLPGPTAGAFVLVAAFGNTGYVGYPLAQAMLGESGLVRAVFSDVFGNTAAVVIVGTLIAARLGDSDARVHPVKEIVTYPPFIALALALLLRGIALPIALTNWLDAFGKVVVPVIMISLGLTLRPRALGKRALPALLAAGVKLVVLPAMALGIGVLLLKDADTLRIVVLQASVPSMMLAMIIGERFKLDTEFIASAILVTMVGSVLTIPLLQLFVG